MFWIMRLFVMISYSLFSSTIFASAVQMAKKAQTKKAAELSAQSTVHIVAMRTHPQWPNFEGRFYKTTEKLFEGHFCRWDVYKAQKLAEHDWLPEGVIASWFWKKEYPQYRTAYCTLYKQVFKANPNLELARTVINKNVETLGRIYIESFAEQN